MIPNPNRRLRPLLLAGALLVAAAPLDAQRIDPTRVFDLTLQADGQILSTTIREGGSFRLTVQQRIEYELVPVFRGEGRDRVTLAVYRAEVGAPESRTLAERVEIQVGVPATLRVEPSWQLVLDRVRTAPASGRTAAASPVAFLPGAALRRVVTGNDQCCVCCGNLCACACGVGMSCGSCCMPGCCQIEPTSNPSDDGDEARRAARLTRLLGEDTCSQPFRASSARLASTL
jgi:hypothetical protein